MLAKHYYNFKLNLADDGTILCYAGYVTEDVLFALGETLKRKMSADEADRNLTRRLFSVFVEQVQNIIRYSDEQLPIEEAAKRTSSGLVLVGCKDEQFFVLCANTINPARSSTLKERLATLDGLSKDELRSLYKERLRAEPDEGSFGGSVGLIEIARRSSQPMEYDFTEVDDETEFFCLKAYI